MAESLKPEIRAFIVSNFMFGKEGTVLKDDQSFLETGVVDSTGLLELVSFVEQNYGIVIDDRELIPANLDSVANLSAFVSRKREAAAVKQ